jgi:broad specificity phosphatase PhoE
MSLDEAPSLIIVRHGETQWNRDRRVMGNADIPLTERGREQCALAARALEGFGIQRVVTSPLVRAAETAAIIGNALRVPISEDPDLEEVRFGHWQGKTYDEIAGDPEYRAFAADPVGRRTPGGETIEDVQRRGLASFARVASGERVLFVSHGDIIRSTLCHYLSIPIGEFRRVRVDNCGISAVTIRSRRPEVKFVNMLADPERVWEQLHWAAKPV